MLLVVNRAQAFVRPYLMDNALKHKMEEPEYRSF